MERSEEYEEFLEVLAEYHESACSIEAKIARQQRQRRP
jgi:hypothetical protein